MRTRENTSTSARSGSNATWRDAFATKLQGDAAKWWTDYKGFLGSFDEFRRSFLRRLADLLLLQDMVQRRSGQREKTEAFVCRKRLLARRLLPRTMERELVDLCVRLLWRDIHRYFVDRRPRNSDDLIDIATTYELLDAVRDDGPRQRQKDTARGTITMQSVPSWTSRDAPPV